jgi:hypothetical protein
MDKNQYKELIAEYMRRNAKLEQENLKLRVALCNLRDEYLNMGGDPNQLELFDKDDVSQLKIFESPDGGETVYKRNAGDYDNKTKVIKLHDEKS